jgi:hypothetical protein
MSLTRRPETGRTAPLGWRIRVAVTLLANNRFMPGRFNNYLIAGNLANAFAMGEIGSTDDFFLVGSEPADESTYPLLTGTILDSEGNRLFTLVRNVQTINPGDCSKIVGDHLGYEIHDSAGEMVFKVETRFEQVEGLEEPGYVTTLAGTFYDRSGARAFIAREGESEQLEANAKLAIGFAGGFGLVQGMSDHDMEVARVALASGGSIYRVVTGSVQDEEIDLDGTAVLDAELVRCRINLSTGRWFLRGSSFDECSFTFHGEAANIRTLVRQGEFGIAQ